MKVQILKSFVTTKTITPLQYTVNQVYDVEDSLATFYIENGLAKLVEEEVVEKPKQKKTKSKKVS